VVRPEHADLVPDPAKGTIAGTLSNIVYFGTDTHYHVKLDGGGENFIVRHQNSRSNPAAYETGAKVGIQFEEDAARVLKD
ncbi:MAG: TOBE domain-containing protein, partial [Mesorhizobium sp.]